MTDRNPVSLRATGSQVDLRDAMRVATARALELRPRLILAAAPRGQHGHRAMDLLHKLALRPGAASSYDEMIVDRLTSRHASRLVDA